MSEITQRDQAETAWEHLRLAIADDYIQKLPESLSLRELGDLLRMQPRDVRARMRTGEIISHNESGDTWFVPDENRAFLMREMLMHLPLPDNLRPQLVMMSVDE